MRNLILSLATILLFNCCQHKNNNNESVTKGITKIAFGSCSHQQDSVQLWPEITAENPDIMVLTGDNIYGDTQDMAKLKKMYDLQKNRASYQQLLKKTKVIGVWDDHDYGVNDGGKHYTNKDSSKYLMLDFFDVPINDPVRNRQGVYSSHTLNNGDHSVKIILLDTRYFRDTLKIDTTGKSRYIINEHGDILGEEQWKWLENELKNSTADVNIIGSSIQVLAEEQIFEKWANFPVARKKLLGLINDINPKNTVIISGDRHIAEISSIMLDNLDYPLYDFTSSGLTHTWAEPWAEQNRYRIGKLINEKNYGIININWEDSSMTFEVKGNDQETYYQLKVPIKL
ncbi:MAG TPA: alkaline phosphatase D family protein [Fulvivirga sp.]|nr:alkaline phosphatase D family protein [Fulvivirga sp.]